MLEIITTADGSKTIYNSEVGENYHSRHGALQESLHVFLGSGLKYYLENKSKQSDPAAALKEAVSILEVGLGTGLNFLLSADYCEAQNIGLDYTGIESSPLDHELISQTGYKGYVSTPVWDGFMAGYLQSLENSVKIGMRCRLRIARCGLTEFSGAGQYDVIYFDAFASATQPEMWNERAITHTIKFLKPGGVFVTYAITGNLKRMLKTLGLKVEKAPGAAGKREMLRAVKPA